MIIFAHLKKSYLMRYTLGFLGVLMLVMTCSSCSRLIYPNRMFQQGDYQYFEVTRTLVEEYVIQPGDDITLKIYSRDGFKLIDVINGEENQSNVKDVERTYSYLVDNDGFANLPILGTYYVQGYTERELEEKLEEEYGYLFSEPYAIVQVVNRRAFVFKGSEAAVVSLNEAPTNLIEVLAKAGGLDRYSKAYNIKLIRGDLENPQVLDIDLSTINGLQDGNIIVQSNDIIYIEERRRMTSEFLKELTPILALISTITTTFLLIRRL